MSITQAVKRCTKCGETKSLTDFHRQRNAKDGRHSWCAECMTAAVKARQAQQRAEMGDEAWLEHKRQQTAKSRQRRGFDTERAYGRARRRAVQRLIEMYPQAFEHLMRLELDTERRKQATG